MKPNSEVSEPIQRLQDTLGGIDIYLLDQIVKGRVTPEMRVLDAGCGSGRNLIYLAREGGEVWGVDRSADRAELAARSINNVAPNTPADRFRSEAIESLTFADEFFDAVICSAVLHFANDQDHFHRMLAQLWRVLKPEGLFFARLASSIGIEEFVTPLANGCFQLPDGSQRFLVDESTLLDAARGMGAELVEPIKTTNVQGLRCMTTWVLRKALAPGG